MRHRLLVITFFVFKIEPELGYVRTSDEVENIIMSFSHLWIEP